MNKEVIIDIENSKDNDLISREALKHKLQENYDFFVNAYGGFSNLPQNDKSRVDEILNCIAMIVNEPSIKPQEKTGHWIRITNGAMKEKYICSKCGRQIEDDGIEGLLPIKYPYCHCGCRMVEPQERSDKE